MMRASLRTEAVERSIFVKIWLGIFLSATSSFLLLTWLSAWVFERQGSALMANAVVLTQWAPAVLALPLIRALSARFPARQLLAGAEAASAALLLALPPLATHFLGLLCVLLLRGFADSLSKVARTVALKDYFSGDVLNRAASYYSTSNLVGGAVGALLGTATVGRIDLLAMLPISFGLQSAAAALYWSLPPSAGPRRPPRHAEARTPPEPLLRAALLYYVGAVCLFQGYHNVARSVFPIEQLGLTKQGIPLIQAVTNLAYIGGAFAAARLLVDRSRYGRQGLSCHLAGLAAMSTLPFVTRVVPGLAVYGVFAFCFEVAFCVHLRAIIVMAPVAGFSDLMARVNAWAVGSMVAVSMLGSLVVDRIGLLSVTALFAAAAAAVPLASTARAAPDTRGEPRSGGVA